VTLQVTAGNTAPVATDDTMSIMDGTSGTIWVAQNDNDAEGQDLTYTLLSNAETLYGTIQLDAFGILTYQAQSDTYCNTDLLEYRVCDPLGMCDTALVVVYIIPADLNMDGIPDILEGDWDEDNIPDSIEAGTFDICQENFRDTDNDGTPDYKDDDSDGDGHSDLEEGVEDCDNDGIPNYLDAFDDCGDRLKVPSTFSPNADMINDTWVIPGISDFPDNELFIYNRWGGLVFRKKGYDNTWYGRGSSGMLGSDQLAEGTYFYILKLGDRVEKGTVYIKR
jgi:gliding motility-associated-like protein